MPKFIALTLLSENMENTSRGTGTFSASRETTLVSVDTIWKIDFSEQDIDGEYRECSFIAFTDFVSADGYSETRAEILALLAK